MIGVGILRRFGFHGGFQHPGSQRVGRFEWNESGAARPLRPVAGWDDAGSEWFRNDLRPDTMERMFHPDKISVIGGLLGLAGVLVWRIREGRTAVTLKKIVIPPLGMASGFSMFLVPQFRFPWTWGIVAFLIGAVGLAYPLLRTSRLVVQGKDIMMQRSTAFFTVILVLAAVRILAHGYFDQLLSVEQSGALFFVLAFGMILRWRANMLLEYRRLTAGSESPALEQSLRG